MPSPSGKSSWVHDQGLPPHLVTQVSRCYAWPHDGVQGELKWTTPFSGGLGVCSGSKDMNVWKRGNVIMKATVSAERQLYCTWQL